MMLKGTIKAKYWERGESTVFINWGNRAEKKTMALGLAAATQKPWENRLSKEESSFEFSWLEGSNVMGLENQSFSPR